MEDAKKEIIESIEKISEKLIPKMTEGIKGEFSRIEKDVKESILRDVSKGIEGKIEGVRKRLDEKINDLKSTNEELKRKLEEVDKWKFEKKLKISNKILGIGGVVLIFIFILPLVLVALKILQLDGFSFLGTAILGVALVTAIVALIAIINKRED